MSIIHRLHHNYLCEALSALCDEISARINMIAPVPYKCSLSIRFAVSWLIH